MNIQILNYGAFLRLTMDSNVFMLAKAQIKSIEVIRDDTVRINNGEGPLHEVLIKLADVTQPAGLLDVAALRDVITRMLDTANQFEVDALGKLQTQIEELTAIKLLFNLLNGSLQIDLNFQQLQVNALVAINDKLQRAQENDDKIVESLEEQTGEMKDQTQALTSIGNLLTSSKAVQDSLLAQAISHSGILTTQTATLEVLSNTVTGHTDLLTAMKALLEDIKTNTTP